MVQINIMKDNKTFNRNINKKGSIIIFPIIVDKTYITKGKINNTVPSKNNGTKLKRRP